MGCGKKGLDVCDISLPERVMGSMWCEEDVHKFSCTKPQRTGVLCSPHFADSVFLIICVLETIQSIFLLTYLETFIHPLKET